MRLLLIILLILLVAVLFGGYTTWGPAPYGPVVSWSPVGVIIVLLVVLWAAGLLRI